MIKLSSGLRKALVVTGSLRASLNNGLIHIYSGAIPASADDGLGGAVLLNTISAGGSDDPLTFEALAPSGVLVKSVSETWVGNNLADGTPTFFRFVLAGDAGDSSSSAVRFQGTAGVLGRDMFISSLPLVTAEPLSFQLFQLAIPEQ